MFRQAYQRGLLSIFYSIGSKPLAIWDTFTRDGYIKRFLDEDIRSMILEIGGTNVSTTYIVCPKGKAVLGISMPFLVMVVKNLKKYFSFEVTILDDTGTRRRFRISNFQSTTQVLPLCTVMPIGLSEGWNQIQFNLAEFTRRAYKKQLVEVQKVKINANIRLRRVYFAERLVPEEQLPTEYRLFYPFKHKPNGYIDKITSTEMTQEKIDEIITPEMDQRGEKLSSVTKVKGSMQVIKAVSRVQELEAEDKSSRLIGVPEESPDQAVDPTSAAKVNAETEPFLATETATTHLIKEISEGVTTETASVATELLKEPSIGAEAEDKKEKSLEMIAEPVTETTDPTRETSASDVKETDNHAVNVTPVEGSDIGNEEDQNIEEGASTEPLLGTEE